MAALAVLGFSANATAGWPVKPVCGNCKVEPPETCDDGNTKSGDGCSKTCQDECLDTDYDTVCKKHDMCPGTEMPETKVPTSGALGVNRWALGDGEFVTNKPNGNGPNLYFDIEDTAGCSCKQIIAGLSLGNGHSKFGCSISAMKDWVAYVDAQPLVGGGTDMGDLELPESLPESEAELEESVEAVAPQMGCNVGGGQPGHGPAWAFLGLVLATFGLRRRS